MIGREGGGGAIGATIIDSIMAADPFRIAGAFRVFSRMVTVRCIGLIAILVWMTDCLRR
ncbi:hypothetical protein BLA39750_05749 [Burkholderia lata]|uniref:Uncharacterized protein n=1 Tax=Burkholderia lata (strain ATCC 17760 / DSM 23089 / LMG 22485 / NCIMB 9086 / R18194 / 383) TaxID=482957 RepID=A0A6P3ARA1_BURL3|nr:hypothetical protein BLA39750_05749 [Burkholderia lata]